MTEHEINNMYTVWVAQDPESGWFCKKNVPSSWMRRMQGDKLELYYTPFLGRARIYHSPAVAKANSPRTCEIIAFVCTQIGGKQ